MRNRSYPYYKHENINNLKELLVTNYNNYPNEIAFSYKENDVIIRKTYKDVYEEVKDFSNYLYKKYKNKHIAIVSENSYNFIITFFAIILSGNVCVIIDKDAEESLIKELVKKTDTKTIFYSEKYCGFVKKLKYKTYPMDDINDYLKKGKKEKNKYEINNDKPAVIFFTSGTTGPNKGVVLSQKNMAANIFGASSLFKPYGKIVSVLPFHHAFGLVTSILKPFYYHKEVFINSSLKEVLDDFKLVKPNTIFVVPTFVETFYKQIWRNAKKQKKIARLKQGLMLSKFFLTIGLDMRRFLFKDILDEFGGNLEYIICGGARLESKYVRWFRKIGIEILNGYGITECSPVVSVNRNHYHRDGSVGIKCLGEDVKIIDDEICVKGPSVMLGYYKDVESTKSVIKNGYFHTGDLGYIDRKGFIYITGRIKNLIILSNGENISPELIEGELLKDDNIQEVVVIAKDNKLYAYIYPVNDYFDNIDYFNNLIYNYNKGKSKSHQISGVILRNTEFIKNSNKKILRNRVTEE